MQKSIYTLVSIYFDIWFSWTSITCYAFSSNTSQFTCFTKTHINLHEYHMIHMYILLNTLKDYLIKDIQNPLHVFISNVKGENLLLSILIRLLGYISSKLKIFRFNILSHITWTECISIIDLNVSIVDGDNSNILNKNDIGGLKYDIESNEYDFSFWRLMIASFISLILWWFLSIFDGIFSDFWWDWWHYWMKSSPFSIFKRSRLKICQFHFIP